MPASQALLVLVVLMLSQLAISTTSTGTSTSASTATTHHDNVTKAKAKTKTTLYPDFQVLNVKQALTETKTRPMEPSQYQELFKINPNDSESGGKKTLKLVHRDKVSFSSKLHHNHSHVFHARMQRDVKRVSGLVHRLSSGSTAKYEVEDFGSDVVSGMNQVILFGFNVNLAPNAIIKPTHSLTRKTQHHLWGVSCSSAVCDRVENAGCNSGRCRYQVSYGDGSYTKGTLALETLTFGRTVVRNVAIGCGHSNRGMFVGAAGLLGLGGGSMSLMGQLSGQTGNAFSYCLVSRGTNTNGFLEFGSDAMPVGAAWIPLVRNPRAPSFYYIRLSGLGVGGTKVPISEDAFQLNELGNGGVVMDTGTAYPYLILAITYSGFSQFGHLLFCICSFPVRAFHPGKHSARRDSNFC
ncbi:PROTEIN ASPARTIC PROTEASE IN GUARD CELL 2-LIKE [Salix purpurea]|uniref:PROTEIN ASPARTIC PROTEASE IN GUARD CELL 2-LIKE n=1 Tax=Salix purpurea TaxID=77065 RepID=A0A9Q0V2L4_SALPP|nr:PROTEIN ASPARTIC PROTEASE IN GUARD CELL 2-LIKE [Salix purpurea]